MKRSWIYREESSLLEWWGGEEPLSLVVLCRRRNLLCRLLSSLLWNLWVLSYFVEEGICFVVFCFCQLSSLLLSLVVLCRRRNLLCHLLLLSAVQSWRGTFESCRTLSEICFVVFCFCQLSSLLLSLVVLYRRRNLLCHLLPLSAVQSWRGTFESCRTLSEICFVVFCFCQLSSLLLSRTLSEKESALSSFAFVSCPVLARNKRNMLSLRSFGKGKKIRRSHWNPSRKHLRRLASLSSSNLHLLGATDRRWQQEYVYKGEGKTWKVT